MAEPKAHRMTPEEFFVWQQKQDKLYELVDGVPVLPLKMMTGATFNHDRVTINIIRELSNQLRRTPCRPTTDDIAIRVLRGNIRRPDVMVECGRPGPREMEAREPRMVAEVLSPSTMSYDRLRKLEEYKAVQSLRYILLVDTEAPRVTAFVKNTSGEWVSGEYVGLEGAIDLPEIGAKIALADLFESVVFKDE